MSLMPMTVSAAAYTKDKLAPAKIQICQDKQYYFGMTYFQEKDLKNVSARHIISRTIIHKVGYLIIEHKSDLEFGKCTVKITGVTHYNNADILSATLTWLPKKLSCTRLLILTTSCKNRSSPTN